MSQAKLIGAQLGMAVFGPTGALVGGIAGAVIDAALPWGDDVVKNAVANLLAARVERVASRWASGSKAVTVNHDLQRAFQDAVREALADIGGPTCFPKAWPAGRRDVPPEMVYLSSPLGHTSTQQRAALASQVCQLLTAVARGIEQNQLLPLRPAADEQAGSAMTYIESATSQALADSLYDATILPVQPRFGSLFSELPDLEPHLRRFLLDRTMLHLGELLKRRTESWRAFNRWILEDIRDSLAEARGEKYEIAAGLTAINKRLDLLIGQDAVELGLEGIASATADSVGRVRLAAEDMTLLVNTLIAGVTRQQAQQLAELRILITQQTGVILAAISGFEARLLRRIDLFERTVTTGPIGQQAVTPRRGQLLAAFRAEALRRHKTQSIPWRGAKGILLTLDRVYVDQELLPWDEPAGDDDLSDGESRPIAHGQSPGAALLDQRAIVVLGEPGSGKTLLLHAVALELASTCRLTSDGAISLGVLPAFVPLAGFTEATDDLGVDPAARLLGYVQRVLDARTPGMADALDDLMAQGRVAFLFDALDEVSGRAEQRAALAGIQALAAGAGSRCLFALTVREAVYGGSLALNHPFRVYRLAPLATAAQPAAIRSWLGVLSDLGERDEDVDVIENQTRRVLDDLERHPGMRHALRNPLLLRITLQVYLWARSADTMPGLGKRFDLYVNRLLEGGGESGAREPAWSDPHQARRFLERIAWQMYDSVGLRTLAEAQQLLETNCDLSQANARLFIRQVQENAGLLVLDSYDSKAARPERTALSFGPHALFGDFLVGSVLAQRWREDRRRGTQLLRQKADDPAWQQAVLFCLSLLYAEEAERKAAFGFVLDELARVPGWGVRCLREGLELTAGELTADERRQVVQRLASQADAVLHPNLFKGLRLRLLHRSDSDFRTAILGQHAALAALGKLQLCEVAEPILRSVFWLSADYKHVGGTLRTTLVDFGPRCLWPVIQVALSDGEEWVRNSAAWIVSGWRGPEAIPALEWLLERDEFATAAIYGLAHLTDASVDATYRSLLADPRHADDALSAGLLAQRPGMLEYALSELQAERLAEHHVKFLMEYAFRLSSSEAYRTVREMLEVQTTTWRINFVFEVGRALQLPLLRILVSFLREPDAYLRARVQEAIPRALKAGDLDPHFQDSQGILEQMLLYADDWLPEEALRQLRAVTLSPGASEILWNRLVNPDTMPAALTLLRSGPRLSDEYRHRVVGWLQQEAEHTPSYAGYIYGVLASLGDRSVIPQIVRTLKQASSPWHYDDALLRDLVRLQAVEAFPHVMTCMTERSDWDSDGAVSLGMLAPVLSLEQRRKAANCLRPLLVSNEIWLRWVAIWSLGELKMSTPVELLSQVRDNVLEIQEPAIGLALARLGSYDELAAALEGACARRDATLYFTALHAWGALGDPRCTNPLLQTLGLPDDFLRSADHLLSGGDLVSALRYVKARAATNLGRLAATLAGDTGSVLDPKRGWDQMLSKPVDRNLAGMPGIAPLLCTALAQPAPARLLYDQTLAAKGRQQAVLGWLVGAYEWSEVFAHLARNHNLDSVPIWEAIHTVFDTSKNGEQVPAHKQLAGRIGWTQQEPPFEFLMRLATHRDEALRDQTTYYFAREAGEWHAWLKWRADMLVLPL